MSPLLNKVYLFIYLFKPKQNKQTKDQTKSKAVRGQHPTIIGDVFRLSVEGWGGGWGGGWGVGVVDGGVKSSRECWEISISQLCQPKGEGRLDPSLKKYYLQ